MEHVEHAGIHSGDSACVLPPRTLSATLQQELIRQTRMLARELGVIGLINVQYAIYHGEVYILEVNPRASRTIPFVSKAIGVPLAKLAARVMAGKKLSELGFTDRARPGARRGQGIGVSVRALPRRRYDSRTRDEIDRRGDGHRHARSRWRLPRRSWRPRPILPDAGLVFISVRDEDKPQLEPIARGLVAMGFDLIATRGTAHSYSEPRNHVRRRQQGRARQSARCRCDEGGRVAMVINTPDAGGTADSFSIRRTALELRLPFFTTMAGAQAAVEGIHALKHEAVRGERAAGLPSVVKPRPSASGISLTSRAK